MSTQKTVRLPATLVLLLLIFPRAGVAQSTYGTVAGTIIDQSGAVLPGATVTATNVLTGAVRTAPTDGTGAFLIPNLDAGRYRVDVALSGFASQRRDFELLARQTI